MNKNIVQAFWKLNKLNNFRTLLNPLNYKFSTQPTNQPTARTFTYGQGGQFNLDLTNRTYSLSFQTIWQDHSSLQYSGFSSPQQQKKLFIIQKTKQVIIDDKDLQKKQTEYVKMMAKIPEDYTIRGKINGSVHHVKNNVSSKTRSYPFQFQVLGYKNTFQWLSLECEDMRLRNLEGEININSLTVKDCTIECETFKSKKIMFSNKIHLNNLKQMNVRSIVSYQNAQTTIQNSQNIYIQSLSGKIKITNCKAIKIDRLLSCQNGINIQCDRVQDHIIIQTGSGTIKSLKQTKQILQQKIKLGKMHKGKLDFDSANDPNSQYSIVKILL